MPLPPAPTLVATTALRMTTALVSLLLLACSSEHPLAAKPTPPDAPARTPAGRVDKRPATGYRSQADTLDADEVIRLDRSGCGFRCPAYQLRFFRDGSVRFTGHANTAVSGAQQAQIDEAVLAPLLRDLQAELPAMAKRYTPDSKDCGQMFTDQATTTLSVRLPHGMARAERYGGCPDAPKALAELERRVDAAAASDRWVSAAPTY